MVIQAHGTNKTRKLGKTGPLAYRSMTHTV